MKPHHRTTRRIVVMTCATALTLAVAVSTQSSAHAEHSVRPAVPQAIRVPDGGHRLSATTFIQRLNTSGGVAPSTGCSWSPEDVGRQAFVPYTADYYFYARRGRRTARTLPLRPPPQ